MTMNELGNEIEYVVSKMTTSPCKQNFPRNIL